MTTTPTDRARILSIASDVMSCAITWEPGVRLIGNVTAEEVTSLAREMMRALRKMEADAEALEQVTQERDTARTSSDTWFSMHESQTAAHDATKAALATAEKERDEARAALRDIADIAPECDHCSDMDPPPSPRRPITHETTLFGCPIYLCAEHEPDRVASYKKAESKGCGEQPEVVPYVEPNAAIGIARAALGENGGGDHA